MDNNKLKVEELDLVKNLPGGRVIVGGKNPFIATLELEFRLDKEVFVWANEYPIDEEIEAKDGDLFIRVELLLKEMDDQRKNSV